MQHKIFTALFLTICTQLSASQKIHAPQQKAEQEIIQSLDTEIVPEVKITLRNLYNEEISVPRSWIQHSKVLAAAPEETEIKLPRITSTQALDDVFRALMVLDRLSAQLQKKHELTLRSGALQKKTEDLLAVFSFDVEELVRDRQLRKLKENEDRLRPLENIKEIDDTFHFFEMDNERLLELYASANYLDIPILLEYISPLVARAVLENYFDSECNYIIRNFDVAWEEEMANSVRAEFKEFITNGREKLTPEKKLYGHAGEIAVFWQESSMISLYTQSPYILYSSDSHFNKKLWDNGVCIWSKAQYALYQPYEYDWTLDDMQLAAASGITGNRFIKIWRFDFNLTIAQMALIKNIISAPNRMIAIEQHKNLYQSLPECWKNALEPEKIQYIPFKKWCAQFYSMSPIARDVLSCFSALVGTAWLLCKLKKPA